ncbi:hypothetical protein HYFRA_00006065 [Hymenoscyphus fraxineus]|uniref:Pisatin demethylase n=1 Tax=Hymenoscyphus fraxineus TaxID=746836 RepID=A0A9N9KX50_9HELO|nr:hypothetical protein HYFRA_00006065 [Hymenoscyphus fraxineus]
MGLFVAVVAICLAAFLLRILHSILFSPLRHIPGPFWARFTNLWRLIDHYNATQIITQRHLHEKHGPAVRIGPNAVSLSDPHLIKTVYSTRGNFLKSDFYSVNDVVQDGHTIQNVFGTRSNAFHAKYMKPIQKLYSMKNILEMEDAISKTIILCCEQLELRFVNGMNAGKTCDIADWIAYLSWDVVGEITFSKEMDFLKSGVDVRDTILTAESVMHYFGLVGQMPVLDKWLGKNPWSPIKFRTFNNVAGYCVERLIDRVSTSNDSKPPHDFLNSFIEAKAANPETITDNEVVGYLLLNMLAGADTTAISQKAIVYQVLKNPSVLAKLVTEIDAANIPFPATYATTQKLPYLQAVIKEALRIHPPVGQILERIVPAQGLGLPDGREIPSGTIVGMNPWVVTRNKEIYGEDVELFRPERWLKGEDETEDIAEARLKIMKDLDFAFGGGNRICTGKNLALAEMSKVTATLFGRYEMKLVKQDWKVHYWWFVFTDKIKIKLSRRNL